MLIVDFQSARRRVAAVAEQEFGAGGQGLVYLETGHAAHRADAGLHTHFVLGDEHDRPMIFFRQAPGHDTDDAGMPTTAGEHQRGIERRIVIFLELFMSR